MFGRLLAARIVASNSGAASKRARRRKDSHRTADDIDDDWSLTQFYVQSEGLFQPVHIELRPGCQYHVCVSSNNEGAADVVAQAGRFLTAPVLTTTNVDHVVEQKCPCMLLLLTADCWTNGDKSKLLEEEVLTVLRQHLPVFLVHEQPSVELNAAEATRHECEFDQLFVTTPQRLLQANIYGPIATPLAGGAARMPSLWTVANELAHLKVRHPATERSLSRNGSSVRRRSGAGVGSVHALVEIRA